MMPGKNLNIQLIIEGCRRKNRNSQRILFEHFAGYAMNICLRYSKNREEAEEILNNGFLKVFNNIEQYDTAYPFRIWMRRIMINAAIDYHRKNKKHLTFIELNPSIEIADEDLSDLSLEEDALPILQQLPPTYQMVFNLAVMEGYKHDEIAALLGISASTSRSNLARTKNKLKTILLNKKKYSLIS